MLGLFLIYFIGRYFYKLAEDHNKSKWAFAILGVISYYAGIFLGGIFIGLFYALVLETDIESSNNFGISLLALPFGIFCCWMFYRILKNRWSKEVVSQVDIDVLDQDFI